jgi:hypothetical protein
MPSPRPAITLDSYNRTAVQTTPDKEFDMETLATSDDHNEGLVATHPRRRVTRGTTRRQTEDSP